MHDVIVVGAGPAGSEFARQAASAGHDVVVFESGEVGNPLACSGHVSTAVLDFLPESRREDLIENEIRGAQFHLGGPHSRAYRFYKDSVVSQVIDREAFDRTLADLASKQGATVREGHTVTDVDQSSDHVEVTVRTPDGQERHRSRLLAGCDGPHSQVRRAVGLPDPRQFLTGVFGFDDRPDDSDFVDVHLTVPGFFAWRIPRGNRGVEYGLATGLGESASKRFHAFCASYGVDIDSRHRGVIPVGPPARVTSDRTFLIGDAAAQTKPFTGGGIRYALVAANHAARTIDPADPDSLSAYERTWRGDLGREIQLGRWIRRAYSLPTPLQRMGLGLFSGKIGVDIDEPSSLLSLEQMRALWSR